MEARPELGYAPMKSEEYRTGYSLESLRDVVEQGDLTTEESRNGYYLHDSISTLFDLVWNGVHEKDTQLDVLAQTSDIHVFRMKPLQGDVFNPAFTPLLHAHEVPQLGAAARAGIALAEPARKPGAAAGASATANSASTSSAPSTKACFPTPASSCGKRTASTR